MSEFPIADALENALGSALAEQGEMFTGFVCVAVGIDAKGSPVLHVVRPGDQATHVSMGMLAYATEWFRDDARYQINQLCEEDE